MLGYCIDDSVVWDTSEKPSETSLSCDQTSEIIDSFFFRNVQKWEDIIFCDASDPCFKDDDCLIWTCWTKSQFQTMLDGL